MEITLLIICAAIGGYFLGRRDGKEQGKDKYIADINYQKYMSGEKTLGSFPSMAHLVKGQPGEENEH